MVRRNTRLLLGRQQRQGPRLFASKTSPIRKASRTTFPTFPASRDLAWQNLYQTHKGQIDEQFAFLAFRTAPLVSASTMDAKVATSDMANQHDGVGGIRKAQPARMGARRDPAMPRTTACTRRAMCCSAPKSRRACARPFRRTKRSVWPPRRRSDGKPPSQSRVSEGPSVEGLGAAGFRRRHLVCWQAQPPITAFWNRTTSRSR